MSKFKLVEWTLKGARAFASYHLREYSVAELFLERARIIGAIPPAETTIVSPSLEARAEAAAKLEEAGMFRDAAAFQYAPLHVEIIPTIDRALELEVRAGELLGLVPDGSR